MLSNPYIVTLRLCKEGHPNEVHKIKVRAYSPLDAMSQAMIEMDCQTGFKVSIGEWRPLCERVEPDDTESQNDRIVDTGSDLISVLAKFMKTDDVGPRRKKGV